jgi:hypothetical protein
MAQNSIPPIIKAIKHCDNLSIIFITF